MSDVDVMRYLRDKRTRITKEVREFLYRHRDQFSAVNRWGDDVIERLSDYAAGGKMIRGGLVYLGAAMYGGASDDDATVEHRVRKAAGALELIQCFLLIHDDIMDQDELRRGKPTIHAQYARLSRTIQLRSAGMEDGREHFGRAMAICAGDIALLLAFELAGSIGQPQISELIAREISYVGLAQMNDVFRGLATEQAEESEILNLYRFKTGRYTFSVPLMIGAMIAGAGESDVELLSELGEYLGVIFQVRDDEIGLFSDSGESGKPAGSDISSGKQTLHRLYLRQNAGPAWPELARHFGSPASADSIAAVRNAAVSFGVRERIAALVAEQEKHALALIERLSPPRRNEPRGNDARRNGPVGDGPGQEGIAMLLDLVRYNSSRSR